MGNGPQIFYGKGLFFDSRLYKNILLLVSLCSKLSESVTVLPNFHVMPHRKNDAIYMVPWEKQTRPLVLQATGTGYSGPTQPCCILRGLISWAHNKPM